MIPLALILVIVGVFMIAKPSTIWMVTVSWKSNGATEPSILYIWSTRFGGIILTLVGIFGGIASFLSNH